MGPGFVSPALPGAKCRDLAAACDPHLPSIGRKIQKTDEGSCDGQSSR